MSTRLSRGQGKSPAPAPAKAKEAPEIAPRPRGRPRKSTSEPVKGSSEPNPTSPRPRGRPKKIRSEESQTKEPPSSVEVEDGQVEYENETDAKPSRQSSRKSTQNEPNEEECAQTTGAAPSVGIFSILKSTIAMREALAKERKSWHGSDRNHSPASSQSGQRRHSARGNASTTEHSDLDVSDSQLESTNQPESKESLISPTTDKRPGGRPRRSVQHVGNETDTETDHSALSEDESGSTRSRPSRRSTGEDPRYMRGPKRKSANTTNDASANEVDGDQTTMTPNAVEECDGNEAADEHEADDHEPEITKKRGRGRPKRNPSTPSSANSGIQKGTQAKAKDDDIQSTQQPKTSNIDGSIKRGPGRPKKSRVSIETPVSPVLASPVAEVGAPFSPDDYIPDEEDDMRHVMLDEDGMERDESAEENKLVFGSEPVEVNEDLSVEESESVENECADKGEKSQMNSSPKFVNAEIKPETSAVVDTHTTEHTPDVLTVQKRGRGRPKKKKRELGQPGSDVAEPVAISTSPLKSNDQSIGSKETRMLSSNLSSSSSDARVKSSFREDPATSSSETEGKLGSVRKRRGKPPQRRSDHSQVESESENVKLSGTDSDLDSSFRLPSVSPQAKLAKSSELTSRINKDSGMLKKDARTSRPKEEMDTDIGKESTLSSAMLLESGTPSKTDGVAQLQHVKARNTADNEKSTGMEQISVTQQNETKPLLSKEIAPGADRDKTDNGGVVETVDNKSGTASTAQIEQALDDKMEHDGNSVANPSDNDAVSKGSAQSRKRKFARGKKRSEIELLADVDGPPSKLAKLRNPPSKNIYQKTVEEAARSAQEEAQTEAPDTKRMTTRGKKIHVADLFSKPGYMDDFISTDEAIMECEGRIPKLTVMRKSASSVAKKSPIALRGPQFVRKPQQPAASRKSPNMVQRSPKAQVVTNIRSKTPSASLSPAAIKQPTKPSPAKILPIKQSPAKILPIKHSPANILPIKLSPARTPPAKVSPSLSPRPHVSPVRSDKVSQVSTAEHILSPLKLPLTPPQRTATPVMSAESPASSSGSPLSVEEKLSMCTPCKVVLIDFIKILDMVKTSQGGMKSPASSEGLRSPGKDESISYEGVDETLPDHLNDGLSLSPKKSPGSAGFESPKTKSPKCQPSSPYESHFLSFVQATEAKMAPPRGQFSPIKPMVSSPPNQESYVTGTVTNRETTVAQIPRKATARKQGVTARKSFKPVKKGPPEKYRCLHCNYTTNGRTIIQEHIYNHTDIIPYSCGHCQAIFGTRGGVIIHTKREHKGYPHDIVKNSDLDEEKYYTTVEDFEAKHGEAGVEYTMPPGQKPGSRKRKHSNEPQATYTIVKQPTESAGQIPKLTISRKLVNNDDAIQKESQQFAIGSMQHIPKAVKPAPHQRARIPSVNAAPDPTKPYYQCKHCTFAGVKVHEMEGHSISEHYDERRLICPLCDMAYCKTEDAMRRHYQKWHPHDQIVLKYEPDYYNVGNMTQQALEALTKPHKRKPSEAFPALASSLSASSSRVASPALSHSSVGTEESQEKELLSVQRRPSHSRTPSPRPRLAQPVILKVPTFSTAGEDTTCTEPLDGTLQHLTEDQAPTTEKTRISLSNLSTSICDIPLESSADTEDTEKEDNGFEIKIVNVCSLAEEQENDASLKRTEYNCKYCNTTSLLFDVILNHVHKEHQKEYWFACPYCPFASAYTNRGEKGNIMGHIRTLHPQKPSENIHIGIVDQENYFHSKQVTVTLGQVQLEEMEAESNGIIVRKEDSTSKIEPLPLVISQEKSANVSVDEPKLNKDEDDVIIVAQDVPKKTPTRPVGPVKPIQVIREEPEQPETGMDLSTRGPSASTYGQPAASGTRVLGQQAPVGRFSPPSVRPPSQAVRGIPARRSAAPNVTVQSAGPGVRPPPLLPLGAIEPGPAPEKRRLQVPPLIRAPVSTTTSAASAAARMAMSAAQEQRLAHVAPLLAHQPTSAVRPMPQLQPRGQSPAHPSLPSPQGSPEAEDEEAVKRAFSIFNIAPRARAPPPPSERPAPPPPPQPQPRGILQVPMPHQHHRNMSSPVLRPGMAHQQPPPPSLLPRAPPPAPRLTSQQGGDMEKFRQFNVRPRPPRMSIPRVPQPAHSAHHPRTGSPRDAPDIPHGHMLDNPNVHWTCPYCPVPNQMTRTFVEKHIQNCHPGSKIMFIPFGAQ